MTDREPLLLAGTRVADGDPHIGTLYGWIKPVVAAAESMNVVVLIADLQSLDPWPQRPMKELADNLIAILRPRLPASVSIIRESQVRHAATLARLIVPLFSNSHWNRIAPLRKLQRTGQTATVATMHYPAMMTANVLAFNATHILAKPEGRFQHSDVINDILTRGAKHYGWPAIKLQAAQKPKVDIRSPDGHSPLKRNTAGCLPLTAVPAEITSWTDTLTTPGWRRPGSGWTAACTVIRPIWMASAANVLPDSQRARYVTTIQNRCTTMQLSCGECKERLAEIITADLMIAPQQDSADQSSAILNAAVDTTNMLINIAIGAEQG